MSPGGPRVEKSCPLPSAHSRLHQAHRLWHQVQEQYPDAEGFSVNLNASIECLRTVSFLLQKEKRAIPDFDPWYEGWRQRMGDDPTMRWLLEARNKIEKQGDLDTYSTARVSVLLGYAERAPILEFEAPPLLSPQEIAATLVARGVPAGVRDEGVLIVERRWVARDMPTAELLDVLAYGYGVLSTLVAEAHGRCGQIMRTFSEEAHRPGHIRTEHLGGRLPCMISASEARTARFHMKQGMFINLRELLVGMDDEKGRAAVERYGTKELLALMPKDADAIEASGQWFEMAKRVLQVDGAHAPMVQLYGPDGPPAIYGLDLPDRQGIYVQMERLAQQVMLRGSTSLVFIGEMWIAPLSEDADERRKRASERDDRGETLVVAAESADGRARTHWGLFSRKERGEIIFEKAEVVDGPLAQLASLTPVRRVWRRAAQTTPP